MSKYRENLPQLGRIPFLTDGGLETTMVFINGIDLPEFAAFILLDHKHSVHELIDYYLPYIELAKKNHVGFILESPTWRASADWGRKLGYDQSELREINRKGIELMLQLRSKFEDEFTPMPISGCIGPRGDGYQVQNKMNFRQAHDYHSAQVVALAETEADLVSAFTINYAEEAIGITLAAEDHDIPVVIAFTLETDGRLPSGQPLQSAIEEVDAATANGPAYYMINCAHPSHFSNIFMNGGAWLRRIKAIRANASCKSHSELDDSVELDRGNPAELAKNYQELGILLPDLKVIGGCCGTDFHHIEEICEAMPSLHHGSHAH